MLPKTINYKEKLIIASEQAAGILSNGDLMFNEHEGNTEDFVPTGKLSLTPKRIAEMAILITEQLLAQQGIKVDGEPEGNIGYTMLDENNNDDAPDGGED